MRDKDRRQFIRLRAHHLVKYRPLLGERNPTSPVLATINDIGGGGVCLKTEEYLPISSIIELKINFPNISTSIFSLARIVWIKQRGKSRRYDVGAQFVDIEGTLRGRIVEQVNAVSKRLKNRRSFFGMFFPLVGGGGRE